MAFWARLRRHFRPDPPASEIALSEEDIVHLRVLLHAARTLAAQNQQASPVATYEQLVRAAWANLAIEEPNVTLEQAREVIDRMWPEISKNTPDLKLEEGYRAAPIAR